MMKILFIKPLGKMLFKAAAPPLGLMYISSYLREYFKDDITIKIIDNRLYEYNEEQLYECIRDFEPSIVGLSSITVEAEDMYAAARAAKSFNPRVDYEDEYRTYRDSLVKRFTYTIELFWKYIKNYLEVAQVLTGLKIPSEVMREAFSLRLLSEDETEKILEMIKSRNMTSHIYIEEIAERLAVQIPDYAQVLKEVIIRLKP